MKTRLGTLFGTFFVLIAVAGTGYAQESAWPRTLTVTGGDVTVYPLQVEEMTGDLVKFRAALAYRTSDVSDPVFGAGWFVSKVEIDRANDVVHPVNLVVSDTRFPPGTDDVKQDLTAVFAQQSHSWNLDFPLTDLMSALEMAEQEAESVNSLNTTPPAIIYKDHPALLVNFDGEPVLRTIENSEYQAVVNTSYPLIYDGNAYHLAAADEVWYRADQAIGPYRFESNPPADIVAMVGASGELETEPSAGENVNSANAPEIVVATTPTELIVTEGPAAFVPLVDDLLVLNNTSDDVFMHISSQQYYVVLAGRWYHSGSLNGPWTYSASDALPEAFAAIPDGSDQAGSRVYVAGTEEARDAVLDAQIPQTAAVERGTVDLDVTYDGDPQFVQVEGAEDLAYANNSGSTVLQADRQYYLVEDGVWYESSLPNGPWEVSVQRPAQVASISPRSPVYNVKYVYIYDSTPDVVYVGYTPGYTGSYVYQSTIVYGTGFYYRPWVSPYYYYPRYSTWGFNVNYNSWSGWSFGLSWGWGPFYAGYYSGGYWHRGRPWYNPRYNCWGPRGYRPRPAPYARGGRYAHGGGGYNRGNDNRGGQGRHHNGGGRSGNDQNLYRGKSQRARVAQVNDYGRKGGKASRGAVKNSFVGSNGRNAAGTVSNSELRMKAQSRNTRFDSQNGKALASNSRVGKQRATALDSIDGQTLARKQRTRSVSGKAVVNNERQQGSETGKVQGSTVRQRSTGAAGDRTRQVKQRVSDSSGARTSQVKQRTSVSARTPDEAVKQRSSATARTQTSQVKQRNSVETQARSNQVKQRRSVSSAAPASNVKQRSSESRPSAAAQTAQRSNARQATSSERGQQRSSSAPKSRQASRPKSSSQRQGGSRNKGGRSNQKSGRN